MLKKLVLATIVVLSLVGNAGQASADPGKGKTASPAGVTWENSQGSPHALGVTWE